MKVQFGLQQTAVEEDQFAVALLQMAPHSPRVEQQFLVAVGLFEDVRVALSQQLVQAVAKLPGLNRIALQRQSDGQRPEGGAAVLLERANDDTTNVFGFDRNFCFADSFDNCCSLSNERDGINNISAPCMK